MINNLEILLVSSTISNSLEKYKPVNLEGNSLILTKDDKLRPCSANSQEDNSKQARVDDSIAGIIIQKRISKGHQNCLWHIFRDIFCKAGQVNDIF